MSIDQRPANRHRRPLVGRLRILLLLGLAACNVPAAEVSLRPINPAPVDVGDFVTFEIAIDFTGEGTLGGSFDVLFDPDALAFYSLTYNGIGGLPDPDLGVGILENWTVFNFSGLPDVAVIGTVTFTTLSTMCGSALVGARDWPNPTGGWVDLSGLPISVDYTPGSIARSSFPQVNDVKQIRITASGFAPQLQVSEVLAFSNGVDLATIGNGATAAGDGTGPAPGTTGGAAHGDNAIDGLGPSPWPDIFSPDTDDPAEFLLVTLSFPDDLQGLSILGSTTVGERDIYDVELLDSDGAVLLSCRDQSADNPANEAVVIPTPPTILLTPLGSTIVDDFDIVTFEVTMDFTGDPTIGGGIDVFFDPNALQFHSLTHSGIGLEKFQRVPIVGNGILEGWGAGDYDGLPELASLGTVSFVVLPEMCGSTALSVADNITNFGPFFSYNGLTQQEVAYNAPALHRASMPPIDGVDKIRITSHVPTWLQVSEVVALAGSVDVATTGDGAAANGDGTGPLPGTTGGAAHADNAIDGLGPSAWPDIFHTDTDDPTELLLVDLDGPQQLDSLFIQGRDILSARDVYDVELLDGTDTALRSCFRQSADNPAREAVVIPHQDSDGDGVANAIDNCQLASNPDQIDSNNDNIGNACDADIDNDCVVNFGDLAALKAAFLADSGSPQWNPDADFDSDGFVNFNELAVMKSQFLGAPGPSAMGCN